MSSPGSMGQQAAQQAAASASRGAQQSAATSYDMTMRSARSAARRHRRSRGGLSATVSRLVALVFSLVIVAATVWIVLVYLRPDWLDYLASWFERTF